VGRINVEDAVNRVRYLIQLHRVAFRVYFLELGGSPWIIDPMS
jgi:hypothetical protein